MNVDKLYGAVESLIDKVNETALQSPPKLLPNDLHYTMLGKTSFALEILPMVGLLKKIIQESEGFEELRRSYRSSSGSRLEEFLRGDGTSTRTVVELDSVEQKETFNELLDKMRKLDA